MPSTTTSLVIFVLLLAPGFVSLLISERGLVAGRETTMLRETATIALSSAAFDVVAALLIAMVVRLSPWWEGPDLVQLAVKDGVYLRQHWVGVAGWLMLVVVVACLCAILWAGALNRTNRFAKLRSRRPAKWLFPFGGGTEYVSAWWALLVDRSVWPDLDRYVTCKLADDCSVSGWLQSASHEAKDSPDRELILQAPLVIRDAQGQASKFATGAMSISASQLKYLYVRYVSREAWSPDDGVHELRDDGTSSTAAAPGPT